MLSGDKRRLLALQHELPFLLSGRGRHASSAQALALQTIADATTIGDVRRAVGRSQQDVAEAMKISQKAVSQLENRRDLRLSTVCRYFAALGMELRMTVAAGGTEVKLRRLAMPDDGSQAATGEGSSAAGHAVAPSADHP
ncbi:helix-turn-helix domain-containing protein [Ramlibacter humi]|uniref:XRE family transcriptional regulator n=1 Tax=Ramlibacter humi TaxID=2530451 RepID=A0A4Z0BES0_9BURK|nr:helix-turn-helix transcriptional regulator [Ramlibacter humi]TFY96594.1 XRE family transcriptional regulator [Ramlibacter humi]